MLSTLPGPDVGSGLPIESHWPEVAINPLSLVYASNYKPCKEK